MDKATMDEMTLQERALRDSVTNACIGFSPEIVVMALSHSLSCMLASVIKTKSISVPSEVFIRRVISHVHEITDILVKANDNEDETREGVKNVH